MIKTNTLPETAQRILAFLEEAGQEEVHLAMNSIFMPPRSPDALDDFVLSLTNLVNLGFIRMARDRDATRRLIDLDTADSISAVLVIPTYMQCVADDPYWVDSRVKGPPYKELLPVIVLTKEGYTKGRELINTRGWEWWNPRVKTK
jgi:hypothetical protein